MLTFNVILLPGVPGLPIPRLLVIFFRFLFSVRPPDPILGNAFDAKRKKKGDGLSAKSLLRKRV